MKKPKAKKNEPDSKDVKNTKDAPKGGKPNPFQVLLLLLFLM